MKKPSVLQLLAAFLAPFLVLLAGCGGGTAPGTTAACMSPVPNAPTVLGVTAGNASVTVMFAPASNSTGITEFTVTSTPGNIQVKVPGTASSATVTGLANGTTYTFTVKASSCAGTSPDSAPSTPITPTPPAGAPGAPTGVVASLGTKLSSASVAFTPPGVINGSPITGYTVTSNPGNITATGTASPIVVIGLSNNVTYTFTVTATNAVGTSVPSAPSNAVTPTIAYTGPFYVNGTTGLDTNNGAVATPFQTITQGLAVTRALGTSCTAPCTINVAAGTYSAPGETFPLQVGNFVTLTGASAVTTTITGTGSYTPAGTTTSYGTTLVFASGVSAAVSGFSITGGYDAMVIVDNANASVSSTYLLGTSSMSDGAYVLSAASATVSGSTISGACWRKGGLYISGSASVTGRGNSVSDTCNPAVNILGGGASGVSPTVDMGTAGTPGGNIILGAASGVGMSITNDGNFVNASGNTWRALVQGADASGVYAVGTLGTNPTPVTAGNNYAITGSAGLRF